LPQHLEYFVLWGDSHAKVFCKTIDRLADEYGLVGEAQLANGKIPVTGLWRASWSRAEKDNYLEDSEKLVKSIIDREVPNLILVCRWAVNCDGRNQLEIDQGKLLADSLVTDTDGVGMSSISQGLATKSVRIQLERMLERLTQAGVRVWILKQVPETNRSDTARQFYFASRFPRLANFDQFTISLKKHEQRQLYADRALDGLESTKVTVIDPSPAFFDNEKAMLKIYSDRSYYRDDDHLTSYGVEQMLGPVIDQIMSEIRLGRE